MPDLPRTFTSGALIFLATCFLLDIYSRIYYFPRQPGRWLSIISHPFLNLILFVCHINYLTNICNIHRLLCYNGHTSCIRLKVNKINFVYLCTLIAYSWLYFVKSNLFGQLKNPFSISQKCRNHSEIPVFLKFRLNYTSDFSIRILKNSIKMKYD